MGRQGMTYNFYDITLSNSTNEYVLRYELEQHRPAQEWANIMSNLPVEMLRPNKNPWHGIVTEILPVVDELMLLIDDLNSWLPDTDKINLEWNHNDVQDSVNRFHIHFPQHKDDPDPLHRTHLTRYNDIMHELENIERCRINQKENLHLLICPAPESAENIAKFGQRKKSVLLNDDDYQYFSMDKQFGWLIQGYFHIGRHPYEVFNANDVNVPDDQILCQSTIGPIHYLHFTGSIPLEYKQKKFKDFYYSSGIKWPYALDDPKLAVGFIPMGKLKYINGVELSEDETYSIVRSCNKIVDWKIYENS
jgi:hypothetical protein